MQSSDELPDSLRLQAAGRRSLLSSAAALAAAAVTSSTLAMTADDSATTAAPDSPADLRSQLLKCLGGPWPDQGPLDAKVESSAQLQGFRRERISYLVEPAERIVAWLLIPDGVSASSPAPGICVWHQHAGQYDVGKDEPAGVRAPNFGDMHQTGVALAREGYVVLCPDAAGFGERNHSFNTTVRNLRGRDLEHYLFGMYVADGKCLAWKNISDMRRAVDYISSRPEVLPEKLGCYGHSMGSTHTWQVGPWEPRLKALVGNCCMPTYAAMERTSLIHCFPNYVPGWRQFGDIPDIVKLIAPRPLHLNFGDLDAGSPIEEVRAAMPLLEKTWAAAGAPQNFSWFIEASTDHVLSPEMWRLTKAHFAKHLNR
jgi:dienelactone hydrolase